jgi:hypothetical protein
MNRAAIIVAVMLGIATPAFADVHFSLNLSGYPQLVPVPGYPVYYAPRVDENYFFYDGLYWVFDGDEWYASSWYNGPWRVVPAFDVPSYVLRVPVRYYRHAPAYFRGWRADAAPRWGDHWGRDWAQRRGNWNERSRSAPARAPLPTYQREYAGNRYPKVEQQQQVHTQNYHYQPREQVARQHYQQQGRAEDRGRGQDQGGNRGEQRGGRER